jgi:hypothetical protein
MSIGFFNKHFSPIVSNNILSWNIIIIINLLSSCCLPLLHIIHRYLVADPVSLPVLLLMREQSRQYRQVLIFLLLGLKIPPNCHFQGWGLLLYVLVWRP